MSEVGSSVENTAWQVKLGLMAMGIMIFLCSGLGVADYYGWVKIPGATAVQADSCPLPEELTFNGTVQSKIGVYAGRKPNGKPRYVTRQFTDDRYNGIREKLCDEMAAVAQESGHVGDVVWFENMAALIMIEGGANIKAISPCGAVGPGQVMPNDPKIDPVRCPGVDAKAFRKRKLSTEDLLDPLVNIRETARIAGNFSRKGLARYYGSGDGYPELHQAIVELIQGKMDPQKWVMEK